MLDEAEPPLIKLEQNYNDRDFENEAGEINGELKDAIRGLKGVSPITMPEKQAEEKAVRFKKAKDKIKQPIDEPRRRHYESTCSR